VTYVAMAKLHGCYLCWVIFLEIKE